MAWARSRHPTPHSMTASVTSSSKRATCLPPTGMLNSEPIISPPMPFLRSFSINTEKTRPFPFSIPAVKFAKQIALDPKVTIFVGDNGCGKSTLLESIAFAVSIPLIGGHIAGHAGFDAARAIRPYLDLTWGRQTSKGFFFRAEDFSDFINGVEKEKGKISDDLRDLRGNVDDFIIEQMSESMNFSLREMRKNYGENMQAFSHGEAYLKILE